MTYIVIEAVFLVLFRVSCLTLFLVLFRVSCLTVHRFRHRNRTYWFLERVRSSIAAAGDPGPWRSK